MPPGYLSRIPQKSICHLHTFLQNLLNNFFIFAIYQYHQFKLNLKWN